ncbi:hypothetical protein NPIL_616411 [Nephila pilipes]|uniref:Uncharacterized protein n=1 Tax=Nephila pilipes TaxID=299642 RepID=A0A8X6UKM0_NEPPI|nr:hypothetical protein NPIL_616411 [Nephila pilipes]
MSKNCRICARNKRLNVFRDQICSQNHSGSSSGMKSLLFGARIWKLAFASHLYDYPSIEHEHGAEIVKEHKYLPSHKSQQIESHKDNAAILIESKGSFKAAEHTDRNGNHEHVKENEQTMLNENHDHFNGKGHVISNQEHSKGNDPNLPSGYHSYLEKNKRDMSEENQEHLISSGHSEPSENHKKINENIYVNKNQQLLNGQGLDVSNHNEHLNENRYYLLNGHAISNVHEHLNRHVHDIPNEHSISNIHQIHFNGNGHSNSNEHKEHFSGIGHAISNEHQEHFSGNRFAISNGYGHFKRNGHAISNKHEHLNGNEYKSSSVHPKYFDGNGHGISNIHQEQFNGNRHALSNEHDLIKGNGHVISSVYQRNFNRNEYSASNIYQEHFNGNGHDISNVHQDRINRNGQVVSNTQQVHFNVNRRYISHENQENFNRKGTALPFRIHEYLNDFRHPIKYHEHLNSNGYAISNGFEHLNGKGHAVSNEHHEHLSGSRHNKPNGNHEHLNENNNAPVRIHEHAMNPGYYKHLNGNGHSMTNSHEYLNRNVHSMSNDHKHLNENLHITLRGHHEHLNDHVVLKGNHDYLKRNGSFATNEYHKHLRGSRQVTPNEEQKHLNENGVTVAVTIHEYLNNNRHFTPSTQEEQINRNRHSNKHAEQFNGYGHPVVDKQHSYLKETGYFEPNENHEYLKSDRYSATNGYNIQLNGNHERLNGNRPSVSNGNHEFLNANKHSVEYYERLSGSGNNVSNNNHEHLKEYREVVPNVPEHLSTSEQTAPNVNNGYLKINVYSKFYENTTHLKRNESGELSKNDENLNSNRYGVNGYLQTNEHSLSSASHMRSSDTEASKSREPLIEDIHARPNENQKYSNGNEHAVTLNIRNENLRNEYSTTLDVVKMYNPTKEQLFQGKKYRNQKFDKDIIVSRIISKDLMEHSPLPQESHKHLMKKKGTEGIEERDSSVTLEERSNNLKLDPSIKTETYIYYTSMLDTSSRHIKRTQPEKVPHSSGKEIANRSEYIAVLRQATKDLKTNNLDDPNKLHTTEAYTKHSSVIDSRSDFTIIDRIQLPTENNHQKINEPVAILISKSKKYSEIESSTILHERSSESKFAGEHVSMFGKSREGLKKSEDNLPSRNLEHLRNDELIAILNRNKDRLVTEHSTIINISGKISDDQNINKSFGIETFKEHKTNSVTKNSSFKETHRDGFLTKNDEHLKQITGVLEGNKNQLNTKDRPTFADVKSKNIKTTDLFLSNESTTETHKKKIILPIRSREFGKIHHVALPSRNKKHPQELKRSTTIQKNTDQNKKENPTIFSINDFKTNRKHTHENPSGTKVHGDYTTLSVFKNDDFKKIKSASILLGNNKYVKTNNFDDLNAKKHYPGENKSSTTLDGSNQQLRTSTQNHQDKTLSERNKNFKQLPGSSTLDYEYSKNIEKNIFGRRSKDREAMEYFDYAGENDSDLNKTEYHVFSNKSDTYMTENEHPIPIAVKYVENKRKEHVSGNFIQHKPSTMSNSTVNKMIPLTESSNTLEQFLQISPSRTTILYLNSNSPKTDLVPNFDQNTYHKVIVSPLAALPKIPLHLTFTPYVTRSEITPKYKYNNGLNMIHQTRAISLNIPLTHLSQKPDATFDDLKRIHKHMKNYALMCKNNNASKFDSQSLIYRSRINPTPHPSFIKRRNKIQVKKYVSTPYAFTESHNIQELSLNNLREKHAEIGPGDYFVCGYLLQIVNVTQVDDHTPVFIHMRTPSSVSTESVKDYYTRLFEISPNKQTKIDMPDKVLNNPSKMKVLKTNPHKLNNLYSSTTNRDSGINIPYNPPLLKTNYRILSIPTVPEVPDVTKASKLTSQFRTLSKPTKRERSPPNRYYKPASKSHLFRLHIYEKSTQGSYSFQQKNKLSYPSSFPPFTLNSIGGRQIHRTSTDNPLHSYTNRNVIAFFQPLKRNETNMPIVQRNKFAKEYQHDYSTLNSVTSEELRTHASHIPITSKNNENKFHRQFTNNIFRLRYPNNVFLFPYADNNNSVSSGSSVDHLQATPSVLPTTLKTKDIDDEERHSKMLRKIDSPFTAPKPLKTPTIHRFSKTIPRREMIPVYFQPTTFLMHSFVYRNKNFYEEEDDLSDSNQNDYIPILTQSQVDNQPSITSIAARSSSEKESLGSRLHYNIPLIIPMPTKTSYYNLPIPTSTNAYKTKEVNSHYSNLHHYIPKTTLELEKMFSNQPQTVSLVKNVKQEKFSTSDLTLESIFNQTLTNVSAANYEIFEALPSVYRTLNNSYMRQKKAPMNNQPTSTNILGAEDTDLFAFRLRNNMSLKQAKTTIFNDHTSTSKIIHGVSIRQLNIPQKQAKIPLHYVPLSSSTATSHRNNHTGSFTFIRQNNKPLERTKTIAHNASISVLTTAEKFKRREYFNDVKNTNRLTFSGQHNISQEQTKTTGPSSTSKTIHLEKKTNTFASSIRHNLPPQKTKITAYDGLSTTPAIIHRVKNMDPFPFKWEHNIGLQQKQTVVQNEPFSPSTMIQRIKNSDFIASNQQYNIPLNQKENIVYNLRPTSTSTTIYRAKNTDDFASDRKYNPLFDKIKTVVYKKSTPTSSDMQKMKERELDPLKFGHQFPISSIVLNLPVSYELTTISPNLTTYPLKIIDKDNPLSSSSIPKNVPLRPLSSFNQYLQSTSKHWPVHATSSDFTGLTIYPPKLKNTIHDAHKTIKEHNFMKTTQPVKRRYSMRFKALRHKSPSKSAGNRAVNISNNRNEVVLSKVILQKNVTASAGTYNSTPSRSIKRTENSIEPKPILFRFRNFETSQPSKQLNSITKPSVILSTNSIKLRNPKRIKVARRKSFAVSIRRATINVPEFALKNRGRTKSSIEGKVALRNAFQINRSLDNRRGRSGRGRNIRRRFEERLITRGRSLVF